MNLVDPMGLDDEDCDVVCRDQRRDRYIDRQAWLNHLYGTRDRSNYSDWLELLSGAMSGAMPPSDGRGPDALGPPSSGYNDAVSAAGAPDVQSGNVIFDLLHTTPIGGNAARDEVARAGYQYALNQALTACGEGCLAEIFVSGPLSQSEVDRINRSKAVDGTVYSTLVGLGIMRVSNGTVGTAAGLATQLWFLDNTVTQETGDITILVITARPGMFHNHLGPLLMLTIRQASLGGG